MPDIEAKSKKKDSNIQTYRVLVGFVTLYLIMAIGMADFTSAGLLMFASIICTAGLGLIIWFPLSWLTGFVVIYLFNSIRRKSFLPPKQDSLSGSIDGMVTAPIVSNDVLAIAQYIAKSRQRGASDSQITNRLKWTGWTDRDIGLAFSYLNNSSSEA